MPKEEITMADWVMEIIEYACIMAAALLVWKVSESNSLAVAVVLFGFALHR